MLLAFGGGLFAGAEQWSMSLKSTPTVSVPGNQAAESATLDSIAAVVGSWFTSAASGITSRATLNWLKWNLIGTDGKYANGYTNLLELEAPLAGPSSSAVLPPQIALVVTLLTDQTRGLASKGRVFLPIQGVSLGTDGRLTEQYASGIATSFAGFVSALNATAGYGLTEVVSNVREGAQNPVTAVSCGRVLDTMRSRRAQLLEERVPPVAVAAGG